MKNSSKINESSKYEEDQQVAAISSSLKDIRRVADTNQLRLRHLELAIMNLTSICNSIRNDMYYLSLSSNQGTTNKVRAEVVETRRRSSSTRSSLDMKSDVLGVQMQQLLEQAAALGLVKDSNTKLSGNREANSKIPTRPPSKKVQATITKKISTKSSLVSSMESTTDNKTSKKQVKNSISATQATAKGPPERCTNSNDIKASAKVLLKSTAKTRTTISKVAINQSTPNKSKEITAKNTQTKASMTVRIMKAKQEDNKSHTPAESFSSTKISLISASAPTSDAKPRRKWSINQDITLK